MKSFLPYKLGYYEVYKGKIEDFPEYFEHISLHTTEKGIEKLKKYNSL